ncbi:guanylyl and adenylyl cyclase family member, partial [Haematococcus lacustris]
MAWLAYCGRHEQVSILFSDIVGFSSLSAEVAPEAVFAMLNELYSHFDELTQSMPSVYKTW